jgi:ribosome-associated protein
MRILVVSSLFNYVPPTQSAGNQKDFVLDERMDVGQMTGSDAVEPHKSDQRNADQNVNDQIGGDKLLSFILDRLDQDQAEDVVTIDLAGKSAIADYMVVASGRSTRQVAAMTDKLTDDLKQKLGCATRTEGKAIGDWVLVDAGDVIVHLFRPEVREFYQLEKMWLSGPDASQATSGHG